MNHLFRLSKQKPWLGYAIALGLSLLAAGLRVFARPVMGETAPLSFFTIAIAASAVAGGIGPGMVSIGCSLILGNYLFLAQNGNRAGVAGTNLVVIVTSGLVWMIIVVVSDAMRRLSMILEDQKALAEAERQQFDAVLQGISEGFFIADGNLRLTYANRSFCNWMGKSVEELLGRRATELLSGDRYDELWEALRKASVADSEAKLLVERQGGQWYDVRAYGRGGKVSVFMTDVTSQVELEQRRESLLQSERAAREEAERANQMKDEFVATLSHELRTPLTAIIGWAEILKTRPGLDQNTQSAVESIEMAGKRQASLVEELLDASRLSVGKVKLDMQRADVVAAVEVAVQAVRPEAETRKINLTLSKPEAALMSELDPDRFHQVMANILSNALKFTPVGGWIDVKVAGVGSNVDVTIRDNGQGISMEAIETIFDRFRQARSGLSREQGGLGLGLSIARQLVELHGGNLTASSPGVGGGSTFSLSLPRVEGGCESKPAPSPAKSSSLRGLRILLVDDHLPTRDFISYVLTEAGAQLEVCESGQSALDLLEKENRFDLIVSDLAMPGMDGYQMMRAYRAAHGPMPPAVALSAIARPEDRFLAIESGYQAHLSKPVEVDALIESVASLTRSAPVPRRA